MLYNLYTYFNGVYSKIIYIYFTTQLNIYNC